MEYALVGGAVVFVLVVIMFVFPNDCYTRWQESVDTPPLDLRRADDGLEQNNQPPNMTWMWD